jgi:hypothetical protein
MKHCAAYVLVAGLATILTSTRIVAQQTTKNADDLRKQIDELRVQVSNQMKQIETLQVGENPLYDAYPGWSISSSGPPRTSARAADRGQAAAATRCP